MPDASADRCSDRVSFVLMNERARSQAHRVIALILVATAVMFALRTTVAPAPQVPTSPTDFSIDNALAYVRMIASEPHPNGSVANGRVREWIIDELAKLGVKSEVLTDRITDRRGDLRTVRNILARLPGKSEDRGAMSAVMLVAHYDSVVAGPGASDDGAGVAALLETVRALRAGPALAHDVIVLITDGEEAGLLGAKAFCSRGDFSTFKSQVAVVSNFEARGTAGPSVMFETAPHNLAFIRELAASAPYPNANSLSYDVYRLLPNDTDFTVFRRAGLKGLNFAFIGHYFYYHTKNDSPENLDPGSLYHHGSYALALARHFANLTLNELAASNSDDQTNAIYFNVSPTLLVRYPATWVWPLTVLQWALAAVVLMMALRRGRISWRGMMGAAARLTLALLIVPAAVYGLMLIFHTPRTPLAFNWQLLAIVGLSVAITLSVALEMRRRVGFADLAAVGVILFSVLSIPVNVYVPGGSFLTVWPGLFAAVGFGVMVWFRPTGWWGMLIGVAAATPAILLLAPLNQMVFVALMASLGRMAAVLSVLVVITAWLVGTTVLSGIMSSPAACSPKTYSTARDDQ
jgi:hypothetical protein